MVTLIAPSSPLRIAVLEADHPLDKTASKYGTYGAVFSEMLSAAAKTLSWNPTTSLEITKFDVERHQLFPASLDDLDAILISGSRANAFDDTPWIIQLVDYIRMVLTTQTRVKVIGVCFGHQIVGRALGSKVQRSDKGWEASVCDVPLNEQGEAIFGKKKLKIFQMHKDIVVTLPEGVQNLGTTNRCEIQGMYGPKRFITLQGHPEFTEDIVREILDSRHALGIFTDDEYEKMIGRISNDHDGVAIAQAFLKFMIEN